MAKLKMKAKYHCSMLAELHTVDKHTDIVLQSDGKSEHVHSLFLSNSSRMIKALLTSTESNLLILPGFPTSLLTLLPWFILVKLPT